MRALIIYFALCLVTLNIKAQEVDEKYARKIAENYFDRNVPDSIKNRYNMAVHNAIGSKLKVKDTKLKTFKGKPSYYINNFEGGGWALVSADRKTGPIIAYSENGSYDTLTLPQVMKDWMAQYDTIIEIRSKLDTVMETKNIKWKDLENGTSRLKQAYQSGDYLVKSAWHQDDPYNRQVTHSTAVCGICPAGCVCIAVSQIVNYWGFATGDKADYEFWNMPNVLYSNSPLPQIDATSYMVKIIGDDKLESDYCDGGCQTSAWVVTPPWPFSGWDDPAAGDVLYDLGYYPYTMEYHDCTWYTYNGWLNLLKGEIDAKRPILYRYVGKHAFICDGYNNSNGNLHFNMGWGGTSANWWSDYEDLNVWGQDYTDMGKHACIVGILPDISTDRTLSATLNSGYNKTWQVKNNLIANTFIVNSGAKCQLVGGNSVSLKPGFWAKPGSRLTVKAYVKGPVLGNYKSAIVSDGVVKPIDNQKIAGKINPVVYPNPAYGEATFDATIQGKGQYQVFDFNGKIVLSGSISSQRTLIDFQNVPQGLYMLRAYFNNQYYLFKIINQKFQ